MSRHHINPPTWHPVQAVTVLYMINGTLACARDVTMAPHNGVASYKLGAGCLMSASGDLVYFMESYVAAAQVAFVVKTQVDGAEGRVADILIAEMAME